MESLSKWVGVYLHDFFKPVSQNIFGDCCKPLILNKYFSSASKSILISSRIRVIGVAVPCAFKSTRQGNGLRDF